eukprot:GHVL01040309.1.p1 GENE.GHVL01040309.1~~GHVL01040309.1.p1  ORF type:complete len:469 (+),score=61.60 GHVL01040309.1:858-2264(+)
MSKRLCTCKGSFSVSSSPGRGSTTALVNSLSVSSCQLEESITLKIMVGLAMGFVANFSVNLDKICNGVLVLKHHWTLKLFSCSVSILSLTEKQQHNNNYSFVTAASGNCQLKIVRETVEASGKSSINIYSMTDPFYSEHRIISLSHFYDSGRAHGIVSMDTSGGAFIWFPVETVLFSDRISEMSLRREVLAVKRILPVGSYMAKTPLSPDSILKPTTTVSGETFKKNICWSGFSMSPNKCFLATATRNIGDRTQIFAGEMVASSISDIIGCSSSCVAQNLKIFQTEKLNLLQRQSVTSIQDILHSRLKVRTNSRDIPDVLMTAWKKCCSNVDYSTLVVTALIEIWIIDHSTLESDKEKWLLDCIECYINNTDSYSPITNPPKNGGLHEIIHVCAYLLPIIRCLKFQTDTLVRDIEKKFPKFALSVFQMLGHVAEEPTSDYDSDPECLKCGVRNMKRKPLCLVCSCPGQ